MLLDDLGYSFPNIDRVMGELGSEAETDEESFPFTDELEIVSEE